MTEKELCIKNLEKLCSKKEMCEIDILEKLKKTNLSENDKTDIIEKLKRGGYIDERRYVRAFIHDKFYLNGWGKLKIKYALLQKKISEEIIDVALIEIDKKECFNQALTLAKQKLKTLKVKDHVAKKQKVTNYLLQRGVDYETIKEVTKQLFNF